MAMRKTRLPAVLSLTIATVAALTAAAPAHAGTASAQAGTASAQAGTASAAVTLKSGGSVDFRTHLQPIDGFGFAEAFQRADILHGARGLSPAHQKEVLDLLFSRRIGAGASILRLGIGSSAENPYDLMKSIQPVDPGGPDAPPQYVWDGDDGGQVWLAQQARSYGVNRFFADAWSPPGYLKTNGTDNNGGALCGLPGTACASGDWRQAYANYLVQYARFYASEGIRITDLGFVNEPDLSVSYASMQITPAQIVDMIKVLGPTVKRSGLPISLVCCDVAGWNEQAAYSAAVEADAAADRWVRTHTGHNYVSQARTPLPTDRRTWMSEWQPNGSTWNEAWDDDSGYAGMVVAEDIHAALTTANVSAYLYWLGASIGATKAPIQLGDSGDEYHVAKRLWAFAAYSRFIRPGAVRVAAQAADPALKISAFRNADGSRIVEVINTGAAQVDTSLALPAAGRDSALAGRGDAAPSGGRATTYLTDEAHSLTEVDSARLRGGRLAVQLPPRSLTTVVLR